MSNGNSVTLVGNITRDPELRFTPSGQATASFGLAVNRRRRTASPSKCSRAGWAGSASDRAPP
jgi:single-stranded DNA-binding protein